MLRLIWGLFVTLIWQSCLHFTYWITIRWFSRTSNTVVLNIFHSVNNFLFSSAKPHHFVGMVGIGLPVSMYTTKTPIDKCRFNVTQLKEFFTFSVKDRYQLNYFICIKDFNTQTITSLKLHLFLFLYLLLSASWKENNLSWYISVVR